MAKIIDMTYLRTIRDTDDPIAQDKPLDIGSTVWMNNPFEHQALSWLMMNAVPARKAHNHIFGHNERNKFPNWVVYTGATESSQATTGLTIDNVFERCAAGQILLNTRTKELIRLTADPTGADTTGAVDRNHGRGAATDLLVKGDTLRLLLPQFPEGFTTGKPQSAVDVYKSFSTGIVSEPISTTYTENNEKYYDGSTPFERDLQLTWMRFNDQLESNVFYGGQKLDSSTYTQNYHTMSGLYDFITTNVFAANNGFLSRYDLLDILLMWRQYYKGEGAIICSSYLHAQITEMAYGQMVFDQQATDLGMNIQTVSLNGHKYSIVEADFLDEDDTLRGTAFLCPKGKIQHRWLEENENHDIHYNPISRDEVHSKEGEIWGEFGYEFFEEETWAMIQGLES